MSSSYRRRGGSGRSGGYRQEERGSRSRYEPYDSHRENDGYNRRKRNNDYQDERTGPSSDRPPPRRRHPPNDTLTLEDGFIKVGAQSAAKRVAETLMNKIQEGGFPPTMLAIGHGPINQMAKAIAIARGRLQDDELDLVCQPAFRERDRKDSLAVYLAKRSKLSLRRSSSEKVGQLSVASGSNPSMVAGAIAQRTRQSESVQLNAIGVDAVANAMVALCFARLYLEGDRYDLRVLPQFQKIQKDGMEMSSMRLDIFAEQI
eukprot:TRINITY_DN5112_c1_g1_i1.p1 TRINITY_DN5112_c1_g1~~TRINITY_DN5112_c1_g1_i1.p1  ORF type:complete len:260 (-),score=47.70 TRINITY_DN5112_c1_g1_i1:289-1068(-)